MPTQSKTQSPPTGKVDLAEFDRLYIGIAAAATLAGTTPGNVKQAIRAGQIATASAGGATWLLRDSFEYWKAHRGRGKSLKNAIVTGGQS